MIRTLFQRMLPSSLAKHGYLVVQLSRRDVLARYQGSVLGISWGFLYPLLILSAYTFVFRAVFKARWPGGGDSTSEFALQVFAGLLVFNLFSEMLSRAPRLVLEQPNLVKRVVFPLEVLPWIALLNGLFHALLGLLVLLGAVALIGPGLTPWALLSPLVLICTIPVLLGLGWMLAGLGVFLRDIGHAMGPAVSMLLFISPVLYPAKALPSGLAALLWLNPLTIPIESLRRVVLDGNPPDWPAMAAYLVAGIAFSTLGSGLFNRLRHAFADEV